MENAKILRNLPANLQSLRPYNGVPQLSDAVEAVPGFRERKREILAGERFTVLSVFLENCHACTTQEDAIDDVQQRLQAEGVNLLVIRVSQ